MRRDWSSKTSNNWRIVYASTEESYDCESNGGSDSGFTERSKFFVRCKIILRSWIRDQLWSDPRSWSNFYDSEFQDLATLRFWVAAKYTEVYGYYGKRFWTATCSRRITFDSLPQFKEFGIFISGFETWYFRDSKEGEKWRGNRWIRRLNHLTSKVEVECFIILVDLILTVVWWVIREFLLRNGILGNFQTPWNLKDGRSTSDLQFENKQPILSSGSKKLRLRNRLTNLWHGDRSQGSLIFLISICLMRWLRQPWRSLSTRSQTSEKEWVSKSSELRIPTDSYEEDNLFTWSTSISVRLEFMKQYKDSQIGSMFACRMTMSKTSTFDGIMHYYQWVKCLQTRSRKDCTSQNYRILFSFRLWWPCMIKKLIETMGHRTISNQKTAVKLHNDQMMRNFRVRNDVVERGSVTKSQKGKRSLRWEESGRVFSVESSRTLIPRRLRKFQSWISSLWKQGHRSETKRAIVFSSIKAKRTDGEEHRSSQGSGNKQENSRDKSEIPCWFKFCKNRPCVFWKTHWIRMKFHADSDFCQNPSCKFWHPLVCLNYKSEKGCACSNKCHIRHLEAEGKHNKMSRKGGATGSNVHKECWDQNTPSNSPKALGTKSKLGKEGPARGIIQKCAPHERSPCAPKFEKYLQAQECWQISVFFLVKFKGMSTPIPSKRPEELELEAESGASMRMMSKQELSSEEMGTVKRSRTPTVVLTSNGEVHTHEEAQVFVYDLNQFVTVQLLEETPAVPVARQALQRSRILLWQVSGREPRLTKNGKSIICKTGLTVNFWKQIVFYSANHKNRWDQRHPLSLETGLHQAHFQVQYWNKVTN